MPATPPESQRIFIQSVESFFSRTPHNLACSVKTDRVTRGWPESPSLSSTYMSSLPVHTLHSFVEPVSALLQVKSRLRLSFDMHAFSTGVRLDPGNSLSRRPKP
jgi:hypothetical protein